MVTITKATAADNIWETIYDVLDAGLTDPNPADTGTRKWLWSTFPDGKVEPTSGVLSTAKGVDYPLITIEAPELVWEKLTLTKRKVMVKVEIVAFSTSKIQSIQLMDSITDALELSRSANRLLNLTSINLDSAENDVDFRDEIKLHKRVGRFSMQFSFKGTL